MGFNSGFKGLDTLKIVLEVRFFPAFSVCYLREQISCPLSLGAATVNRDKLPTIRHKQ